MNGELFAPDGLDDTFLGAYAVKNGFVGPTECFKQAPQGGCGGVVLHNCGG